MRIFLSLVYAFILTACASTSVLQPVPASTEGLAKVYFIRQKLEPVIREYRLLVRDQHVASLADNDYVAVYVPVGDNRIQLDIDKEWPFSFDLPVKSSEPLYVVVSGESSFAGASPAGFRSFDISIALKRRVATVSRAEAERILSALGKKLP